MHRNTEVQADPRCELLARNRYMPLKQGEVQPEMSDLTGACVEADDYAPSV